jgi:CubicO group peptidase (beta-lactamase class C family)
MKIQLDSFIKGNEPLSETGLGISVVKSGRVVFSSAYGFRDRERSLKVTPETIFAIGSTTKAFAGLTFLMLEERGQIDINKPVADFGKVLV